MARYSVGRVLRTLLRWERATNRMPWPAGQGFRELASPGLAEQITVESSSDTQPCGEIASAQAP